jgi:3-deoxy-7-phosphoheptulonate synthase
MYNTDDLRIASIKDVATPTEICKEIPITETATQTTYNARQSIHDILSEKDHGLVVIAGPCSIHDPESAIEYATRLKRLKDELDDYLHIVMRVYFEKPRTTVGWKGLINDPDLDESFQINKGLRLARQLLLDLNNMGMPAGVEYLDIITPQYVTDLVSWGAIGARTTESQVHREVASGLSCPVGFKNGTNGTTQMAIDAIRAAAMPHHFLSLRKEGSSAIFTTSGNADCHIILRGGKVPNYDAENIDRVATELKAANLPTKIMVDFSHANSEKKHKTQLKVGRDVARQIANGDDRLIGVMIESHLQEGNQKVTKGAELVYGQSITDACLGWEDSEILIRELAEAVQQRAV